MLLVIPTMTYVKKVLITVGSKTIGRAIGVIMKGELANAAVTWRQAYFSVVMSGSFQLPLGCMEEQGPHEGGTPSSTLSPTVPKDFYLDNLQEHVYTTWRVTIALFGTINIHGQTNI